MLARHGWRFASFSGIGAFVLIVGVAVQALLIRFGAGAYGSYAGQIAISIELSFVLNWRFTWKSRNTGFWRAGWRFNVQKLLLTVPNLALYAFLVREGLGWLPANLATTAVFTLANYVSGDLWSFTRPRVRRPASTGTAAAVQPVPAVLPDGAVPTASVIIPCKASEATIRATLKSLLAQDYPGLAQVILVGDVGDSTWTAIRDVDDPRLVVLEQEAIPGRRDPNAKRDAGISKATGDILALVDSDIVMDPGWLSTAAAMLLAQGGGLVAGGMRSIHDTFWGRFVDRNVLAAKTPRLPQPYHVTAQNFGRRGYKPPVTANAVFTRTLYESCALDTAWAYGYEDYEWFWRVVQAGHPILFSGALTAAHHHRRSFGRLIMEYKQSARGCAHFIRRHPDSPLARKRKRQGLLLPPAAVMATVAAITASLAGYSETTGALLLAALACLAGREAARARSLEALAYPPATLALGWIYATTIAGGLARDRPRTDAAPLWNNTPPSAWRRIGARISWPLTAILALQAAFSLSLVWSNSAFGDEADYLWQGHLEWAHWLHGYPIPVLNDSGAPQLYPALGALADSVGGLAGARILSLCFMLAANVLLYLTARRLFGFRAAVLASALWGVSEPVLRLAFATYDPLACFLVTLAAWLAIQVPRGGVGGRIFLRDHDPGRGHHGLPRVVFATGVAPGALVCWLAGSVHLCRGLRCSDLPAFVDCRHRVDDYPGWPGGGRPRRRGCGRGPGRLVMGRPHIRDCLRRRRAGIRVRADAEPQATGAGPRRHRVAGARVSGSAWHWVGHGQAHVRRHVVPGPRGRVCRPTGSPAGN
jgi:putative flippase GtrA/GT2 family glycosyltransferase